MSFQDTDPLEEEMGVRCEDMTADQLVAYIKRYQAEFDRVLAVEGNMERSIFRGMKRIYGEKTAGDIVKWVFYRYRGVYSGEVVTFTKFSKGRKWWVDKMHLEMMAAKRAQESRPAREMVSPGARSFGGFNSL